MKKLIMLLAVASIMMVNACNNSTANSEKTGAATTTTNEPPKKDSLAFQALDTTKLAKGTAFYQCSMHADITSDKPGDCPTCGMKLDPMQKM